MLLTHRKLLQSKAIAIENDLRATLRNFGLKVGIAGKVKFEARIKELAVPHLYAHKMGPCRTQCRTLVKCGKTSRLSHLKRAGVGTRYRPNRAGG
jgi:transposase